MEWQHYPPYASNFGGAVVAIIKLTKATLRKVVKDREHTNLDLVHCIKNVEFILNARPISALSDSLDDYAPISPNTFLCEMDRATPASRPL